LFIHGKNTSFGFDRFIINRELEGGYYQLVWKVKTEMS
jgi:hypothetical protein